MSTYREIIGKKIKKVSSDPSSGLDGEMWYNSTTGTLRGQAITQAWSSGSPITTARATVGSGGIPTAAWIAGGTASTPNSGLAITEEFNGSGWSAGGNLNQARGYSDGSGTQTAGLQVGGAPTSPVVGQTYVEEYNGTAWTAVTGTPHGLWQNSVFGIQTAAVSAGQEPGPSSAVFNYNGSSWTTGGTMTTTRGYVASAGTQTAGWIGGGSPPTGDNYTELYDGSSWTASANLASPSSGYAAGANGPQTASIYFGGYLTASLSNTETFDGSSWTSSAAMGTAVDEMGSANNGTSNSTALSAGGFVNNAGSAKSLTEEYNSSINVITAAAWASGGTVPYTSRQGMSFGTQTAAIACGGYVTATLDTAAEYDGSSWTASPALNVAARLGGVAGTTGAGLEFGGIQPPGSYNTNVQTWNGSAWANNPLNLSSGTYGLFGCGTQTAALKVSGENPAGGNFTTSEEYDGEEWAAGGALPGPSGGKYGAGGGGTQTSAILGGGTPSGTSTFEYNGSSFAAGGALINSRGAGAMGAATSKDSALIFGGSPAQNFTEGYDGTTWSTRPSLGTGRGFSTGNGTETAALCVSGGPPSGTTTACEEFTGATETVNIEDFATS